MQVSICPAILLSGQTNSGMLDDAPALCNIPGEDVVYRVSAPASTQGIFVSIYNLTSAARLSVINGNCNATPSMKALGPGNTNVKFGVATGGVYYVIVDAGDTITYDISFGADTGQVYVNIPNTKGLLKFETSACAVPAFQNTKPFLQVLYNNIPQTNPMTLTPLFTTGTMCVRTYFKNTTGVEGIRKFRFTFNSAGFSNIVAPDSIPGNYNPGNWIKSISATDYIYTFSDSAGTGRGDFDGSPNTCLKYEFCFDMIPLTNDTHLTNVQMTAYADQYGTGYSGWLRRGCCPVSYSNCFALTPGGGPASGGATAFSVGFNDPPVVLPVELAAFNLSAVEKNILVTWITASETENDFFTIEKSEDGVNWISAGKIKGAGNSVLLLHYSFTDYHPFKGKSYYMLKQTDFNGEETYSEIKSINLNGPDVIAVYPNPVHDQLIIESMEDNLTFSFYSSTGNSMKQTASRINYSYILKTDKLSEGLYILQVYKKDKIVFSERIIVN
jgi:hypothetical protein